MHRGVSVRRLAFSLVQHPPPSCSGKTAEVVFVDYGNKDRVPLDKLWYLNPDHVTHPAQAIPLKVLMFVDTLACIVSGT